MNKENAGIGQLPTVQTACKPGTFNQRRAQAVQKGHARALIKVVDTPKGPTQVDYKGDLQIGSNRPANL